MAETPPLARTQGRTVGCILNFNCVGPLFCVSFKEPLASTAGNQWPRLLENYFPRKRRGTTTESQCHLLGKPRKLVSGHRCHAPAKLGTRGDDQIHLGGKSSESSERRQRAATQEPFSFQKYPLVCRLRDLRPDFGEGHGPEPSLSTVGYKPGHDTSRVRSRVYTPTDRRHMPERTWTSDSTTRTGGACWKNPGISATAMTHLLGKPRNR